MWRILKTVFKWHVGELRDGGVEACRTCPAKAAIFAAIAEARAAHMPGVAPPVPC